MKIVAGVDCHKHVHVIAFVDRVGEVLEQFEVAANASGYEEAIARSRAYSACIWGLEGAHSYGRGFADALVAIDAYIYEVPGAFTKRHRRFSSRPHKSDESDARAIAETVLRERQRLPRFQVIADQQALRIRYDQRDRMAGRRTEAINRLKAAANQLSLVGVPQNVKTAKALKAILLAADRREGESSAVDALVDEIRFAAAEIGTLNAAMSRIEQIIRPTVERIGQDLLAVFGVGVVITAGLIGHAGNMNNCRNADAFAMRSATAPVSCSSGKSKAVRVNCGGDRQLNKLIHQIAVSQIRVKQHEGRLYYDRKLSEGKTPKEARRCLKRRLATVIYYRLVSAQVNLNTVLAA